MNVIVWQASLHFTYHPQFILVGKNAIDLDFSNVALFKNSDKLLFLDMLLPKPNSSIQDKTLLGIPLILASRLKVAHDKGKFVPE